MILNLDVIGSTGEVYFGVAFKFWVEFVIVRALALSTDTQPGFAICESIYILDLTL